MFFDFFTKEMKEQKITPLTARILDDVVIQDLQNALTSLENVALILKTTDEMGKFNDDVARSIQSIKDLIKEAKGLEE